MQLQHGHLHKIIPEGKKGEFAVIHSEVSEAEAQRVRMYDYKGEYDGFTPGTYTILKDSCDIIMSDTPMEIKTNQTIINRAHGRVLIGGLELGLILLELQKNKRIEIVTVVEKNSEVIDLVLPHLKLDDRFSVVKGDIFQYTFSKLTKFDTIYFDIWNSICGDNVEEMVELKKKYAKHFNKDNKFSYLGCWRESDCKRLNRSYR